MHSAAFLVSRGHAVVICKTLQPCPLMLLPALLQDILIGQAKLMGNNTVKYSLPGRVDVGGTVTARDIMIATGSVPFVPPGIPIDGKTVSCPDKLMSPEQTCSHALCSRLHECSLNCTRGPGDARQGLCSRQCKSA